MPPDTAAAAKGGDKGSGAAAPLTPPLLPRDAADVVDKARLAALVPRHDDSQENVLERLRLWDLHLDDVRPSSHSPSAAAAAVASSQRGRSYAHIACY